MPFNPFAEKSYKDYGIKKRTPVTPVVTYPTKREAPTQPDKRGVNISEEDFLQPREWWEYADEYPTQPKQLIAPPPEVGEALPAPAPAYTPGQPVKKFSSLDFPLLAKQFDLWRSVNDLVTIENEEFNKTGKPSNKKFNAFYYLIDKFFVEFKDLNWYRAYDYGGGEADADLIPAEQRKSGLIPTAAAIGKWVINKPLGLAYGFRNALGALFASDPQNPLQELSNIRDANTSLKNGTYVQETIEQLNTRQYAEEDKNKIIEAAKVRQAEYNKIIATASEKELAFAEIASVVPGNTDIISKAIEESLVAELKVYNGPGITAPFGGTPSIENPLGLASDWDRAVDEGKYFRYSHIWGAKADQRAKDFTAYREGGMDAEQAAALTEDPLTENAFLFIFDPNWVLLLDNYTMEIAWKGVVKPAFKGLGKVAEHTPGLKTIYGAARSLTTLTKVKQVGNAVNTVIDWVAGDEVFTGTKLSAEAVQAALEKTPQEFAEDPRAYGVVQAAFRAVRGYADDIVRGVKRAFSPAEVAEQTNLIRNAIIRKYGATKTVDEINAMVASELDKALLWNAERYASTAAMRTAKEALMPTGGGKIAKAVQSIADNKVMRWGGNLIRGYKGLAVNTWLGMRPAWAIRNWVDNNLKLLLEGVNIFSSIPDLLEDYQKYSLNSLSTMQAAEVLRAVKGMGIPQNIAIEKALMDAGLPKEVINAGMGGSPGELDKLLQVVDLSDILKNVNPVDLQTVPILKDILSFNYLNAAKAEMFASTRLYLTYFLEYMKQGGEDLAYRTIQMTDSTGRLVRLSPELENAMRRRFVQVAGGNVPTPAQVEMIAREFLISPDQFRIVVPTLSGDLRAIAPDLPQTVFNDIVNDLDNLASAAPDGMVTRGQIENVLDNAAAKIKRSYIENFGKVPGLVGGPMPVLQNADEMYNVLVPSGSITSLDEAATAIDNLPRVELGFRQRDYENTIARIQALKDLKGQGNLQDFLDGMQKYLTVERPAAWQAYNDNLMATLRRIRDEAFDVSGVARPAVGAVPVAPVTGAVRPVAEAAPEAVEAVGRVQDEIKHAQGVIAASDLSGINVVGAKNVDEAHRTLQKYGLEPVNVNLDKITEEYLIDLYTNKKPPVVGDTFTNKDGFRIEIQKITPPETTDKLADGFKTYQIDYMTFPKKGAGKTRTIYVDDIYKLPEAAQAVPVTGVARPVAEAAQAVPVTDLAHKGMSMIDGRWQFPTGTEVNWHGSPVKVLKSRISKAGGKERVVYTILDANGVPHNVLESTITLGKESPLAAFGQPVPDLYTPEGQFNYYIDSYEKAINAMNNTITANFENWQKLMPRYWNKEYTSGDIFDKMFKATDAVNAKETQEAINKATDLIHQSLQGMKRVLGDLGYTPKTTEEFLQLSNTSNWWYNTNVFDNYYSYNGREYKRYLEQLNTIRAEVLNRRLKPTQNINITDTDKQVIAHWGTTMVDEVKTLIGDAQRFAIKKRNDLFFDYQTTENWMGLMGNIFPFIRYPSKNLPLWLDMFAEKPHLLGSIVMARKLQWEVNKASGYEDKYCYDINMPLKMFGPISKALGLDNITLHIPIWSWISIMGQIPGATAYDKRKLDEMANAAGQEVPAEQKSGVPWFNDTTILLEQFGLQYWPHVEYLASATGLLGKDAYPSDFIGGFANVADWAGKELFGFDKNFSIDVLFRTAFPKWWNASFGKIPGWSWEEFNPNNLKDWAMNKEFEGLIIAMPDENAQALLDLTPQMADELIRKLNEDKPGEYDLIAEYVNKVGNLSPEAQVAEVQGWSPEYKAVYMLELQKSASRLSVRKGIAQQVVGDITGTYAKLGPSTEQEATAMRYERRQGAQAIPPGEERRAWLKQYDAEHPQLALVQSWVYNNVPFSNSAAGAEAEKWQFIIDDYSDRYYTERKQIYENALIEQQAAWLLDPTGTYWKKVGAIALRERVNGLKEVLNNQLLNEIEKRYEDYIKFHPNDLDGINYLLNGWEQEVYTSVELNDAERAQLNEFANKFGKGEGYTLLFNQLYAEAAKRQPPLQYKHIPGLNEGLSLHLEWSPVGNHNYSEQEIQDYLMSDVLYQLQDKAPQFDDFDDSADFYIAYEKYMENLSNEALKLPDVQAQIEELVNVQKMDTEKATATVQAWYTNKELQDLWKRNDTPYDALIWAYNECYLRPAKDIWYDKVLKSGIKESDPDAYYLLQAELNDRFSGIEAGKLIPFIMQNEEYTKRFESGEWSALTFIRIATGVQLPGFFDSMSIKSSGRKGYISIIWDTYEKADEGQKKVIREMLDLNTNGAFSNIFLPAAGNDNVISTGTLKAWAGNIAQMMDFELPTERLDIATAPEVDAEVGESIRNFGVPYVGPIDQAAFEKAVEKNLLYMRYKKAGDDRYIALEIDPERTRYFGNTTDSAIAWDLYYRVIPPGGASYELRQNPLLQAMLNPATRGAILQPADYRAITNLLEGWYYNNADALRDLGLSEDEYAEVRELSKEYYNIPKEDKNAQKTYLADHPLLKKYFDAKITATTSIAEGSGGGGGGATSKPKKTSVGKPSGGGEVSGGGGGGQPSYKPTVADWESFKQATGQSFVSILRFLTKYWSTGELNPAADRYLRGLYAKMGIAISFEEWLGSLKSLYSRYGTSTRYSTGTKPKEAPRPNYGNNRGSSGIRRS